MSKRITEGEFVDPDTRSDEAFHEEILSNKKANLEQAREAIRRAMKEDGLTRKEAEDLYLPRKGVAP